MKIFFCCFLCPAIRQIDNDKTSKAKKVVAKGTSQSAMDDKCISFRALQPVPLALKTSPTRKEASV